MPAMTPPRMKKHRLPEAAYCGKKTVSFTACELHRRPRLARAEIVEPCVQILTDAANEFSCIVPIYTFMPDHLHVMIMGLEERSRPKAVMEQFKHHSGKWFDCHHPEIAWQDDFYDRIIRSQKSSCQATPGLSLKSQVPERYLNRSIASLGRLESSMPMIRTCI